MARKKKTDQEIFEEMIPQYDFPDNLKLFYKDDEGLTHIQLVIKGDPIPKQSVRFMVSRHFQNGTHICPWCNGPVNHSKGDVVVYRNKTSGLVDVMTKQYQSTDLVKALDAYKMALRVQLKGNYPGFVMFEEIVHVIRMEFIYKYPSNASKKMIDELSKGVVYHKTTRPDLPDNLKKLVNDAMSGLVYKDDGIIASENGIIKRYGIRPGIIIELKGK